MRFVVFLAVLALPAAADEREVFYVMWGTPKHCARALIKPGGTVVAEPFEITSVGVRQGRIWCRLKWFPVSARDGGLFTGGHAQCGEDTVRLPGLQRDGESEQQPQVE